MKAHIRDPILETIGRTRRHLRANRIFGYVFPRLTLLCLVAGVLCLVFPLNPGWLASPVLLVPTAAILIIAARGAARLTDVHAASCADYALGLPDTLSAYVEYRADPHPDSLRQAHLEQTRKAHPGGIIWIPKGPPAWRPILMLCSVVLCVAAVSRPGPSPLPKRDELREALHEARRGLTLAAGRLKSPPVQEVAVSLEQFADSLSADPQMERERILRELRKIQREISSTESDFAGEFLGDLLRRSAEEGDAWDALGRALRKAQWQEAAERARHLDKPSASRQLDSDAEGQILDALRRGEARAGSSDGQEPATPPSDGELVDRLAGLAEQLARPEQKAEFGALQQAGSILEQLAKRVDNAATKGSARPPSSGDPNGTSPPIVGNAAPRNVPDPQRQESVTPLIADGPGEVLSGILETQDTGLATISPQATYLVKGQTPTGPVPLIRVRPEHEALVRHYFESLERGTSERKP